MTNEWMTVFLGEKLPYPTNVPEVEICGFAYGSYLINHAYVMVKQNSENPGKSCGDYFSITYFDIVSC